MHEIVCLVFFADDGFDPRDSGYLAGLIVASCVLSASV